MGIQRVTAAIAAGLALALVHGCEHPTPTGLTSGQEGARPVQPKGLEAKQAGGKRLDAALCAPTRGGFTLSSTNPYFPMAVGTQWTLAGEEEGESITVQITVFDRTRLIEGVTTRVIEERESVDGELLEVSWNYYAQASDGTICYFGEDVDIYEDEGISHEGAWCADASGNAPGIFLPAEPRPGVRFQMELAPGVAEDEGKIVGIGPVEVPIARFTETIRVREFNPLDRGKGYKVFAAGVGLVVDGPVQLVERSQTSGEPEQPIPTEQVCGAV